MINCDLEKVDQHLPKNRIPKSNYYAYCNKYLLYWIGKLGLDDFKFQVHYEQKGQDRYNDNHMGYNEPHDTYILEFKYPVSKETLIHELGHLYLTKELNDYNLIISDTNTKHIRGYEGYLNSFLDVFVTYRLCWFGEYYDLWVEFIEFKLKKTKFKPNLPLKTYLQNYLIFYIDFRFLLKNELKTKLKLHVKRFLKDLRDNAILSAKRENKKLSYQDFQKIDRTLDHFDKIKDTSDSKDIYAFFDSVMAIIKK